MQDKKYLLSIAKLLEEDASKQKNELVGQCLKWLDAERLSRVKRLPDGSVSLTRKQAEHLGAGMLLQFAVMQAEAEKALQIAAGDAGAFGIRPFTVSELLAALEQLATTPLQLEYTYGAGGKPYFKNYPYHFNLSHSGEYIFCVISDYEIGVDIQQTKPLRDDRIAKRFFSEEEKLALAACASAEERQLLFYRLWAGKEAYGKLTGQGVAGVLGKDIWIREKNMGSEKEEYILQEYEIEDYQMAVCKWKQES